MRRTFFHLKRSKKNNTKWEEQLIHLMLYLVQKKSRCCNLEHLHSRPCCWLLPDTQGWLWCTKKVSYRCQLLGEHLISLANYRHLRLMLSEDKQQLGYSNLHEVILVYIIATTKTPTKMRPYSLTEPLKNESVCYQCSLSQCSNVLSSQSFCVSLGKMKK